MAAEWRESARVRAASWACGASLLLALAVACDAPSTNGPQPVAGYPVGVPYVDPSSGQQRVFLYHWPLGATVRVFADLTAQPAGWDLAGAIEEAGRRWSRELYYREASLRVVASPSDADVVVRFDGAPSLLSIPADCGPPFVQGAGSTYFCPTDDFTRLTVLPLESGDAGRVKMEVTIVPSRIASAAELRRIVAHEMGHVLGIGAHSPDDTDLMFAAPKVDLPSLADGQTLRYVLHNPEAITP